MFLQERSRSADLRSQTRLFEIGIGSVRRISPALMLQMNAVKRLPLRMKKKRKGCCGSHDHGGRRNEEAMKADR